MKKKPYFEGEVIVHGGEFLLITKIERVIKNGKPHYKYSAVNTDNGKDRTIYEKN